jgi:phosphinothricin acetyltransferase
MIEIRRLAATDHAGVLAIYNHYVEHTHFTFDVEPFTEDGRAPWYAQFDGARRQCWVAVESGDVMGYAASMALKAKKAYETSVEVSIYL